MKRREQGDKSARLETLQKPGIKGTRVETGPDLRQVHIFSAKENSSELIKDWFSNDGRFPPTWWKLTRGNLEATNFYEAAGIVLRG
jgi:hypothetical protein